MERGHLARASHNAQLRRLDLTNTDPQEHYAPVDFRKLVEGDTFSRVIPALYQVAGSEEQFLREAWNIVAQLSVYSEDIGESPRYSLETLLAGGGDCEDTAILLASMLKAAPEAVNYVVVFVDTGWRQYTIATANHENMLPYPSGVTGWYMEAP